MNPAELLVLAAPVGFMAISVGALVSVVREHRAINRQPTRRFDEVRVALHEHRATRTTGDVIDPAGDASCCDQGTICWPHPCPWHPPWIVYNRDREATRALYLDGRIEPLPQGRRRRSGSFSLSRTTGEVVDTIEVEGELDADGPKD